MDTIAKLLDSAQMTVMQICRARTANLQQQLRLAPKANRYPHSRGACSVMKCDNYIFYTNSTSFRSSTFGLRHQSIGSNFSSFGSLMVALIEWWRHSVHRRHHETKLHIIMTSAPGATCKRMDLSNECNECLMTPAPMIIMMIIHLIS